MPRKIRCFSMGQAIVSQPRRGFQDQMKDRIDSHPRNRCSMLIHTRRPQRPQFWQVEHSRAESHLSPPTEDEIRSHHESSELFTSSHSTPGACSRAAETSPFRASKSWDRVPFGIARGIIPDSESTIPMRPFSVDLRGSTLSSCQTHMKRFVRTFPS